MKSDSYKKYLHGTNILIGMSIGYCEGRDIPVPNAIKGALVATPLLGQYCIEMTLGYLKLQSTTKEIKEQKQLTTPLTPKVSAIIPGSSNPRTFSPSTPQEQSRIIQSLEARLERQKSYTSDVPVQVGYSAIEMAAGYIIGFAFSRLPL